MKGMQRPTIEILNIKFHSRDLDEELTIKYYLKRLLKTLWHEEEGFSGKRPFGNSGWQYEIYEVLISNNAIDGKMDKHGYIEKLDNNQAEQFVYKLIDSL